jgi:hypothetical protein
VPVVRLHPGSSSTRRERLGVRWPVGRLRKGTGPAGGVSGGGGARRESGGARRCGESSSGSGCGDDGASATGTAGSARGSLREGRASREVGWALEEARHAGRDELLPGGARSQENVGPVSFGVPGHRLGGRFRPASRGRPTVSTHASADDPGFGHGAPDGVDEASVVVLDELDDDAGRGNLAAVDVEVGAAEGRPPPHAAGPVPVVVDGSGVALPFGVHPHNGPRLVSSGGFPRRTERFVLFATEVPSCHARSVPSFVAARHRFHAVWCLQGLPGAGACRQART